MISTFYFNLLGMEVSPPNPRRKDLQIYELFLDYHFFLRMDISAYAIR